MLNFLILLTCYALTTAITWKLLSNSKMSDYARLGLEGNLDSGDWVFIVIVNLIILCFPMIWLGIF